jgi:hypothetical protein
MFEELEIVIIPLGVVTLFFLLLTASISILCKRGIPIIPMKWHSRVAKITIILAITHASLVILIG